MLVSAVLAPVAAVAAAGARPSILGEMMDRWHRLLILLLLPMLFVSRGLAAGWFGIRYQTLGTPERAFAGCTSVMADPNSVSLVLALVEGSHTFTSSHAASLRIFSPISLKPFLVSSKRSETRSRTLSVSRFVPSRFICCDSRDIEDVRPKSCTERFSAKRLNSWSSRVSGSSRYWVGCDSNEER